MLRLAFLALPFQMRLRRRSTFWRNVAGFLPTSMGQQVLQYASGDAIGHQGGKVSLQEVQLGVTIGIAMADTRPSRCDCRRVTETGDPHPSLRRTASRCSAPASPSGGIFRRRTGNAAAAAHGGRPTPKPPLVERLPEAAWLRARSNPGSRYCQDLPAGRSLPDRCSGSGHHRRSQLTATPIASAFPQPALDPTDRTSRGVIPPFSGHSRTIH